MMMGQTRLDLSAGNIKPRAVGETLGRFWSYFRRYGHVLLRWRAGFVSTYMQVESPILIGQAVDCFLAPHQPPLAGTPARWMPHAEPQRIATDRASAAWCC